MTVATAQARPIIQEDFTITGTTGNFFGTFGDPIMMPVMTRNGYEDRLVTELKADATQAGLAAALVGRAKITRTQTSAIYLVNIADTKNPVVFTASLVDRDIN